MGKLQDRVALVTGAGRGIGRAIALAYAAEGARVAITARTTAELEEVRDRIASAGGEAMLLAADLTDRAVPAQLVDDVRRAWGQIDVVVNNAGVGSSADPQPVVSFDDNLWDLTLAVNVTAPYLLSKAVLPQMIERRHGRVLMIASINGKMASLHGVAYTASKHGVLGLMRTLATETAGQGITVNAICPGPVHTRMNDRRIAYDADRKGVDLTKHEATLTPIGRRLEPEEIAPLAVYLASDEACVVTGQAYNIDGGVLMVG